MEIYKIRRECGRRTAGLSHRPLCSRLLHCQRSHHRGCAPPSAHCSTGTVCCCVASTVIRVYYCTASPPPFPLTDVRVYC